MLHSDVTGQRAKWSEDTAVEFTAAGKQGVSAQMTVAELSHLARVGRRVSFSTWAEYNEEAATDASRRMREFLNRHLN
jgi:hypothetical protein